MLQHDACRSQDSESMARMANGAFGSRRDCDGSLYSTMSEESFMSLRPVEQKHRGVCGEYKHNTSHTTARMRLRQERALRLPGNADDHAQEAWRIVNRPHQTADEVARWGCFAGNCCLTVVVVMVVAIVCLHICASSFARTHQRTDTLTTRPLVLLFVQDVASVARHHCPHTTCCIAAHHFTIT